MAKWSRVVGISLSAGLALAWASTVEAGQVDVFVNWSGAGCNVCGVADYAIPTLPSWNGGVGTFVDPVPPGALVVQMTAVAQGTGDDQIGISVDGTTLGTSALVGTDGACDSCWFGTPATSATYDAGFPGYVVGGTNTMQLTAAGGIALDGVTLTIVYRSCGDGVTDLGEDCDTAGASATCDADCSLATCGDGQVNAAAGEVCDVSLENPACDSDCTLAECGDEHINPTAGESCDDGNTTDGDGCSAFCQTEGGPSSSGGGGEGGAAGPGAGGASGAGGEGTGGQHGPTGSGITSASGAGGDDDDGDGSAGGHDGSGGDEDGNAGADGSSGGAAPGSDGGCGCAIPRRSSAPATVVVALGLALFAIRRRRKHRAIH